MADYAISNVARRVVYTNTGVGPYAFTFEILANTDIAVYRGSTLLTLTTDYSVTINANGTGSVTLVTAGTGNISIVGARAIQRTSDYTTGGDLFASTLNVDLDSQTIYSQQVAETAERALKAPVTDPTDIAMTLPAKATRAGTVLAFNATTGNPEVGPNIASVTTVAAQSANINTVATNIASVNTVAGNNSNINTVAGVSGNVTTVAGSISNVNTVANDLNEGVSEINTVATDIANVNTVGTNISNVNTVAGISANVTSVAGNATNINTVAGNNTNITTVAGVSGNVTTVAGISANVTTVAGINAAVSTVATNNANVSTVATNIASVNTNATNIVAIQNASTNATNAAASAVSAGNAQTAAEAARDATLTAYDNFDDRYLGSKTSNPTVDNDGNALVAGSLYFNSVSGAMQVYTGSAWVAAYVSGTGFLASANNLSDVASTSSARTNLGVTATGADTAYAFRANNLSDLASASTSRTNLGLGTIATQAANNVNITGGSIAGITDLSVADGGTGASNASGARTNLGLAIGTDIQAYSAQLQSYATNGVAMRNRIINGAMVIDQRNAGASVTITDTGAVTYTLDRWSAYGNIASKFSVQQNAGSVTPPVGFSNYLGVTSLSAYSVTTNDGFTIRQSIEGFNVADLNWGTANAKTVTLSFQVRSSLTGTFGGVLRNGSNNRSYPFTYTISSANTWALASVTVAGDTSGTWLTTNGIGLTVLFGLGVGTQYSGTAGAWAGTAYESATGATSVVGTNGATFYITGVQLEVGSSATGFEYVNYQTSLANCQRYYWKANQGSDGVKLGSIYNASLTRAFVQYDFHVTMRVQPTVTYTIGAGTLNYEYLAPDYAQIYLNVTIGQTNLGAFAASAEL